MRNGMYADELPGWFDPDGVVREPGGEGRMSFSYRLELARAIAVTLTEPGHEGRVYAVTTPDSVTMAGLATLACDATGDPYRYEPMDDEGWQERWRAMGRKRWQLEVGASVYAALRAGEFDVVSDDFRQLTGEEPLDIRQHLERLAGELPLASGRPPPR